MCGTVGEGRGAYLRERGRLGYLGADGRIILKCDIHQIRWVGVDWIDLAQERNKWQAVVNAVMKLRVL